MHEFNQGPLFVRGRINIQTGPHKLDFIRRNISLFGVMGLPWGPLSPQENFGQPVQVIVETTTPEPVRMKVLGTILREESLNASHFGVRLKLSSSEREQLGVQIRNYGFFPTEWMRKYPRIPSTAEVQTFPLHALVSPAESDETPLVFRVENLSPNGLLLSTENQIALNARPGERVEITLDPRGWFPMQLHFQGMICRITDDVHPQTKNIVRYLGVKFTRVDSANRAGFLDLLRDILSKFRDRASA